MHNTLVSAQCAYKQQRSASIASGIDVSIGKEQFNNFDMTIPSSIMEGQVSIRILYGHITLPWSQSPFVSVLKCDRRGRAGRKNAMTLKETNSNEKPDAGGGQLHMLLPHETSPRRWMTSIGTMGIASIHLWLARPAYNRQY